MKMLFRLILVLLVFVGFARADDWVSQTIAGGQHFDFPRVHGGQFLVIKNFTQDDFGSFRGFVTVSKPPNGGTTATVLAAAEMNAFMPDVINTVVIAGPADISAMCGASPGMNCFISYRKDSSN